MASVPSNMIRGVCISCDYDVKNLKAKKYVACDISADDPVFNDFMVTGDPFLDNPTPSAPISPLSELVGLPFRMRKIPANPSLPGNDVTNMKDQDVCDRFTNQEATLLVIAMDPGAEYWGLAPSFWQSHVGNVLITSVDDWAITPEHVEALCSYNFYLLNGPMAIAQEQEEQGEEQVLEFKKVVDKVTPAKFQEYYGYYESIREKENRSWASSAKPIVMTSSVTVSGN